MNTKSYPRALKYLTSLLLSIGFLIWLSPPLSARDFQVLYDLRVDGNVNTPYGGIGRYQNMLTYSEDLDNVIWVKTGLSITPNPGSINAPDGTTSADSIVNGAGGSGTLNSPAISATAGQAYTFSIWLKGTGAQAVSIKLTDNAGTPTNTTQAITLDTTWQRYYVSHTLAVGSTTVTAAITHTSTGSDTIYAWGAQLELSSSPGVYAKTTSGTVAASRGIVSTNDILMPSLKLSGGAITDTTGTVTVGSNLASTGNLQVTGAGPHYIQNGNVGIGTTNPLAPFVVAGASSQSNVEIRGSANNYNAYVGVNAGKVETTGGSNAFFGAYAGNANTAGYGNTFIGARSAEGNVNGWGNTIVGSWAALGSQDGIGNTIIGKGAGYTNKADYNTYLGYEAGYSGSSGGNGNNVFLGYQSGYSSSSGTGNIFIGYQSGYNETGSNKLYIDNSNTATPLIWGDFNTNVVNFTGNVGIGTTGPGSALEVKGANTDQIRIAQSTTSTTKLHLGQFSDGSYIFNNYFYTSGHTTDDATKGSSGLSFDAGGISFQHAPASATPTRVTDMVIKSDGNVGIGTTNPGALLQLGPSVASFSGLTLNKHVTLTSTTNNDSLAYSMTVDTDTNRRTAFFLNESTGLSGINLDWGNAAQDFVWVFGGSEKVRIKSNGNVGIGTTGPGALMQIGTATTNAAGGINFGGDTTLYRNGIGILRTDSNLYVGGEVDVNKISNTSTVNNAQITLNTIGTVIDRNQADVNPVLIVQQKHASSTGDILQLKNNAGIVINVTQAGNVGIGTTGPGEALDVIGNIKTSSYLYTTSGVQSLGSGSTLNLLGGSEPASTIGSIDIHPMSSFSHSSGIPAILKIRGTINQSLTAGYTGILLDVTESALGSGNKRLLDLQVGSSSKFSVDNTGNITSAGAINGQTIGANSTLNALTVGGGYGSSGITMDASGNLQVDGNIYLKGTVWKEDLQQLLVKNNSIRLNSGGSSQDAKIEVEGTAAATLTTIQWNNAASNWSIDKGLNITSGNVGIGTTNPGAKLEVVGGNVRFYETAGGNLRYQFDTDTFQIIPGGAGTGSISATTLTLSSYSSNAQIQLPAAGNVLITGGNVGIGTTGPAEKLHVAGNIKLNSTGTLIYRNNADSGDLTVLSKDTANSVTLGSPGAFLKLDGGAAIKFLVASAEKGYWDGTGLRIGSGAVPTQALDVTGSAIISGSVGIGTTAPGYKLDVSGQGHFTDNVYIDSGKFLQLSGGFGLNLYSSEIRTHGQTISFGSNDGTDVSTINIGRKPAAAAGDIVNINNVIYSTYNGNIGIGTTAPTAAKLQVVGDVAMRSADKIILDTNDTSDSYIAHNNGSNYVSLVIDGVECARIKKK